MACRHFVPFQRFESDFRELRVSPSAFQVDELSEFFVFRSSKSKVQLDVNVVGEKSSWICVFTFCHK